MSKNNLSFETSHETLVSLAVISAPLVICALALFAILVNFPYALKAYREAQQTVGAADLAVQIQKERIPGPRLNAIVERTAIQGVSIAFNSDAASGGAGIEVSLPEVRTGEDIERFRTAIDRIMLSAPEAEWSASKLCVSGKKSCAQGTAAHVLLYANALKATRAQPVEQAIP